MTSFRQWQANRRNAAKSTGPTTAGKAHSRCNAVRPGLTETMIERSGRRGYKAAEGRPDAPPDCARPPSRSLLMCKSRTRTVRVRESPYKCEKMHAYTRFLFFPVSHVSIPCSVNENSLIGPENSLLQLSREFCRKHLSSRLDLARLER